MINKDSIHFHANELAELLIKKNHDYGNSVQEQFDEYGLDSILIRLDDKMRRLKSLRSKDPQVVGESLQDTAKDLSGYALLLAICLAHKQPEKEPIFKFDIVEEINKLPVGLERPGRIDTTIFTINKPSYMDLDDE